VTLIRGIISTGALVAFGVAAVLIIAGSFLGRRTRLRDHEQADRGAEPDLLSANLSASDRMDTAMIDRDRPAAGDRIRPE